MNILTSVIIYLVIFALATMALVSLNKFDMTTVAIFFVAALVSSLSTGFIDMWQSKKKRKVAETEVVPS